MRLNGDENVNTCLDNAVNRESQLLRKKSTIVQCQNLYEKGLSLTCVGGEVPSLPNNKLVKDVKKKVRVSLQSDIKQIQHKYLETLM